MNDRQAQYGIPRSRLRLYASRILTVLLVTFAALGIGIGVHIMSLRFLREYQDSNYVVIGTFFLVFTAPVAILAGVLLLRETRSRNRALLIAFAVYVILVLSTADGLRIYTQFGLLIAIIFFIVALIATLRSDIP